MKPMMTSSEAVAFQNVDELGETLTKFLFFSDNHHSPPHHFSATRPNCVANGLREVQNALRFGHWRNESTCISEE